MSEGRLAIDGLDVRELDRDDLWARIGLVPQKAFLFSGTIASNLRYGKADATDDELWDALRVAQAESFVRELAEGLDAPVTQGGTNLSGGQRQRLAIARALVKRPPIYVFDDSFSALDFKTDSLLRAALAREIEDATVIIVAQRVGTIMGADRIIVLDGGTDRRERDAPRADGDLRDLSRDRLLAAQHGGSGMMAGGGAGARRPPPRPMGGPFGGVGLPPEKPKNFRGTFGRLLKTLRPELGRILIVFVFAIVSVSFAVVGPKILGNATDILFDGVVSQQIPARPHPAAGGRWAARRGQDAAGGHAREHDPHARRRRGLHRAPQHPAVRRGDLHPQLAVQLGAGLHHGRRLATDRLPDASRRRRQAVAAARCAISTATRAATR